MIGYRNAAYVPRERCVELFTWAEDGTRIQTSIPYKPYLYTEDPNGDFQSVFQTPLKKKVFNTSFDRTKYVKETGNHRLFENFGPVQQCLLDTYWNVNESDDFEKFPLKIYYLDIEVVAQEFPKADEAKYEINVITIYDSLSSKFVVWGMKPFTPQSDNIQYNHFTSEIDLLESFIGFLQNDYPDIITGWNVLGFDVQYIINRIKNLLGEESVYKLSPVGRVYCRTFPGPFGNMEVKWYIDGVSLVDYLDIYKRFSFVNRESYRLGFIASLELGETKVEYGDTNLVNLMKTDWNKFVEYNIQDVNLVVKLESKLQYIALLRTLAHTGCTTFEGAMGSIATILGAVAIRARHRNQKFCTFVRDTLEGVNPGAFVAEPQKGVQTNIVSFDANSLYPNIMISLNTSPETKIGKIIKKDLLDNKTNTITIRHINGKVFELKVQDFYKFIKSEQIAISKAGILFSQKTKGVMPEFVDYFYNQRVEVRKQIKKLKKQLKQLEEGTIIASKVQLENEISRLNAKQMSIKILINATYGSMGNKQSPYGDDEIASSITLTGQAVIKQAAQIASEYIKEKYDIDISPENVRAAGDTDSVYLTLKCIPGLSFTKKNKIAKDAYTIAEDLETYLNKRIVEWASKNLNSKDCRLNFKREALADKALFLEKKRYVIHVLDDEGIECDKWKYVGVEIARTTMPKSVKPLVKNIVETLISTSNKSVTDKQVLEAFESFKTLSIEELAFTSSISKYEQYAKQCNEFKTVKSMPCHVKGAYYFNLLLDKFNLSTKYEKVASGDKIKYFYVQTPNKYGISVLAFKYKFPAELAEIFKPDMDIMYEKILHAVIERYYSAMDWQARRPTEQTCCDLFDIFG